MYIASGSLWNFNSNIDTLNICDSTWEKGTSRAFFRNRVIPTVVKNRLSATKHVTYLVTKVKCCGDRTVIVHVNRYRLKYWLKYHFWCSDYFT